MNNPSYLRSTEYEYDRSRGKIHVAERDGMEAVGGGDGVGVGDTWVPLFCSAPVPLPHPESTLLSAS